MMEKTSPSSTDLPRQKSERLPELAADLVRLKVDLIVVAGTQPALAAKSATTTIPIVMVSSADPVGVGLVASLARPGGNVTGLSGLADRAEYQKARDTQGRRPQAWPSWTSAIAGKYHRTRRATERAQTCGSGTEVKIGGDRDSSRCQRFRECLSSRKTKAGRGDYDDHNPPFFHRKKADRRACRQIPIAGYLLHRRSLSMRAGSCPTGRTTLTSIGARLFTWTRS